MAALAVNVMNVNKLRASPADNILVLLSNMADLLTEYWSVPQKYNHLNVARAMGRTSVRGTKFWV